MSWNSLCRPGWPQGHRWSLPPKSSDNFKGFLMGMVRCIYRCLRRPETQIPGSGFKSEPPQVGAGNQGSSAKGSLNQNFLILKTLGKFLDYWNSGDREKICIISQSDSICVIWYRNIVLVLANNWQAQTRVFWVVCFPRWFFCVALSIIKQAL